MDQNISISQGPAFGAGYMPYFYQAGKFLLYELPQTNSKSSNFSEISHYDFTSDLVSKRNWPRLPTVEDIVTRGYFAVPKYESETAVISDKKHTSKIGLDDIISQIRDRYQIYKRNMYEIELGKCYVISSGFSVQAARGGVCLNSKEVYGLTKSLRELYEQQRDERRSLWADTSKLKLLLPEQAQNYLSSYRKVSILEDLEGEEP